MDKHTNALVIALGAIVTNVTCPVTCEDRPNAGTAALRCGLYFRVSPVSGANALRPNKIKRTPVCIRTYLKRVVYGCLALVASQSFLHPPLSLEIYVLVCRCPFCACPVQGFQILESRQVSEHILALEDEAAGLRAQLKRFSRRVSPTAVCSILVRWSVFSVGSLPRDNRHARACERQMKYVKVSLIIGYITLLLVGLFRRPNTSAAV